MREIMDAFAEMVAELSAGWPPDTTFTVRWVDGLEREDGVWFGVLRGWRLVAFFEAPSTP